MKKPTDVVRTTVRVRGELWMKVRTVALARGFSAQEIVRLALVEYLRKQVRP